MKEQEKAAKATEKEQAKAEKEQAAGETEAQQQSTGGLGDIISGIFGGGAAAGGAAASADAPAEEKAEEGKSNRIEEKTRTRTRSLTISPNREGGVRRRHGLRSLRLSVSRSVDASKCLDKARNVLWQAGSRHGIDDKDDVPWRGEETSSGMSRFRSYSLNACGSLSSGFFDCHEKEIMSDVSNFWYLPCDVQCNIVRRDLGLE